MEWNQFAIRRVLLSASPVRERASECVRTTIAIQCVSYQSYEFIVGCLCELLERRSESVSSGDFITSMY